MDEKDNNERHPEDFAESETGAAGPGNRALPAREALEIALQVCAALEHAHEKGEVGAPRLPECLIQKLELIRFPRPQGRAVEFKIPFRFRAM